MKIFDYWGALYPLARSRVKNNFAFESIVRDSSVRGRGKASLRVMLLNLR